MLAARLPRQDRHYARRCSGCGQRSADVRGYRFGLGLTEFETRLCRACCARLHDETAHVGLDSPWAVKVLA